ncbi:hypothetical protein J5N97_019314 [Dioscorea zingiberensis]|uniref:Uncharacterized protein n=1 Tax=Dioscorea zingiberensis TaxID=325984 RepID=A0A9D5HCK2_9LILI|nr:hypothetical protein J5N97_019314 [Dioscorea zingiberensis]
MAPRPSPSSSPSSPLSPFPTTTPSPPVSTPNPTASSTTSSSIPSRATPSPSAATDLAGGSASHSGRQSPTKASRPPPTSGPAPSYFDLPIDEIPLFVAIYFEEPDSKGYGFGPDHPEITKAVARTDTMIGRLIASLESRGIFEDVCIILVGHHGMVGTCDQRLIFLDDLSPWIKFQENWVHCYSPLLAIQPPANIYVVAVVAALNQGLSSVKVENGQHLIVYLKEDLPERLHYSSSYRIPTVIGMLDEGYKVVQKRPMSNVCGGDHGYDNALLSIRSIFVAHGPQFERGRKVQPF